MGKREERVEELESFANEIESFDGVKRSWVYRSASGDLQMVVGFTDEELSAELKEAAESEGLKHAKAEKVSQNYDHIFVDTVSGKREKELENRYLRKVKERWGLENIAIGRFDDLYESIGIKIEKVTPRIVESGSRYIAEFEYEDKKVLQYTPDPAERRDVGAIFVSDDGEIEDYERLIEVYNSLVYNEISESKMCRDCGDEFGIEDVKASELLERFELWDEERCGCSERTLG